MKRLFFLILLLPLLALAQVQQIATGEYDCFFRIKNQISSVTSGHLIAIANQPPIVTYVSASLHHEALIDDKGNVYCWGDNANGECGIGTSGSTVATPTLVTTDSLGNPFTGIVQVEACASAVGYLTIAVKNDGTVWVWGATGTSNRGNGTIGGTNTRPVQIIFPTGTFIKKVQMNIFGVALDSNGNIWDWGGNSGYWPVYLMAQGTNTPDPTTPHKMPLSAPAVDISGGNEKATYALLSDGSLIGWSYYPVYLGLPLNTPGQNKPFVLTSNLPTGKKIAKIGSSTITGFSLMTDSTLYSWGNNATGTVGNGQELNYATYKNISGVLAPYAWDWNTILAQPATQIGAGISFANVWSSQGDAFYVYAMDGKGNIYSWGRNKSGVLGNGELCVNSMDANYPNFADVTAVTPIDPINHSRTVPTIVPICISNPSISGCSLATIPLGITQAHAGPAQTITGSVAQLNGSASNGILNYYSWTQTSGPGSALIVLPTSVSPTVLNLVPGVYTFRLKVIDNIWTSDTSTVTITVSSAPTCPPPVVCPVCPTCPPPIVCPVCPVIPPQRIAISIQYSTLGVTIFYNDGSSQNL